MNNCFLSSYSLSELFGSERADAVQTKAENEAVFAADADVEGVVLHCDRAAVVSVTERVERADKRRITDGAAVFKVKKQRRASVESVIAVADENRGTELRAAQCSSFFAVWIGILLKRWN